ncbi:Fe-S protein assembly co-chaperone HscB [Candidatus Symbiobacter mobilis]|uniref:Co-chaperone protein HscB homolog n=1 Tax=Candidatus Symbiobacter mobilis CR TaxID=946483 RepID=U5NA12_9BURK|nr:Fe-S protein assembly co-chaperone HscB [Candidatus Symbiobacter mobilis]AGX87029.1 molecular chaperone HscB [Candidatus Symbiobacter mobilis CR]
MRLRGVFSGVNLHDDDFALLGLERRFQQDSAQIEERRRALQKLVHPDRFADQGAAAQRVAMQWSVRVHEAYQRLRDPLQRAQTLCALGGVSIEPGAMGGAHVPQDVLLRQIEWGERLDAAATPEQLHALESEVTLLHDRMWSNIATLIDDQQNYAQAAQALRTMMFVQRFRSRLEQRLQTLPPA